MAYEKVELVVAGISGEIYMARVLKDGLMSDTRRKATEDVLRASTEWFLQNKRKMVSFTHPDPEVKPSLFFTKDKSKAERILAILQEDE